MWFYFVCSIAACGSIIICVGVLKFFFFIFSILGWEDKVTAIRLSLFFACSGIVYNTHNCFWSIIWNFIYFYLIIMLHNMIIVSIITLFAN